MNLESSTLAALGPEVARVITIRYVAALLVIACLLVIGQLLVQHMLNIQQGDAQVVNIAGRQRMLSQRLCMLMLESDDGDLDDELRRVADEWERSHVWLAHGRAETGGNSPAVAELFAAIEAPHRAMLDAARAHPTRSAQIAVDHQEAFLDGMNKIVAEYEREAHARVIGLRKAELALLLIALVTLVLEAAYVFRPAVRSLRLHLEKRDLAEKLLLQVSDREQKRLAQDLHDGLSQQLVGVSYLLSALRQDPATAGHRERLDEISRLLAEATDKSRSLARGLYSYTLEVAGLAAALGELAQQTERIYRIPCRVEIDGDATPPLSIGVQIYSIAREAVANAARHAHATAIDIELGANDGEFSLTVSDDGVGIGDATWGMGLHLIQHKARLIGAQLSVGNRVIRGTVLRCVLKSDPR